MFSFVAARLCLLLVLACVCCCYWLFMIVCCFGAVLADCGLLVVSVCGCSPL